jgi:hypothetical protein
VIVLPFAHEAESTLAHMKLAVARTKVTLDSAIGQLMQ